MDSFLHYGKVKQEEGESGAANAEDNSQFLSSIPDSTIDENELLDFSSIDNAFGGNNNNNSSNTPNASISRTNELLGTSLNSKRMPSSSYNNSLSNSYLSQSLSSSIPIKQSLAKALPTLSESYNSNTDHNNKVHKVSTSRRKSSIKRENNNNDDNDDDDDNDDTVERKRRDNMNEKIQELLTLIPQEFFDDHKDKSSGTKDGKPNKGQILTKGLEYIQDLQNKIDENNRKEVELILKLKNLSVVKNHQITDMNLNNTSAEIVLGEIGVGPLAGLVSSSTTVDNTTTMSSVSQKSPNNNFEYGGYDQYGN